MIHEVRESATSSCLELLVRVICFHNSIKQGSVRGKVTPKSDLLLDLSKEPSARFFFRSIDESAIARACTIGKDDTRILGGDPC